MNEVMEAIKKRRSIRAYKEKPVPRDVIDSLLEAARYAPSARNLQQLEYKVITNRQLIKDISVAMNAAVKKENPSAEDKSNFFHEAPLVMIITAPKENKWSYHDAAIASENIMLYAASINLGTCFIGMARFIDKDDAILRKLNITDDRMVAAAIVCGYADEKPPEKEKKLNAEFFD